MRFVLILILAGCRFGAATKVIGGDSGAETEADTGASGADDTADPGERELDPLDIDDDEDGFTENEGDCDDTDPGVRPGVADGCDGFDTDCDGTVDEDAVDSDPYEPNDTTDFDIGELEGDDSFEAEAFLHDGSDQDRFHFSFTDGTVDFFTLEIDLEWRIDEVLYVMTVEQVDTGEILYNEFSTSGTTTLHYEQGDSLFSEDGGNYRITISSDGSATCLEGYSLRVTLSTFF